LIALLAAVVVARVGLALLISGPLIFPVLQIAFVAFMAWRALAGRKRSAAYILGGLFLLGGLAAVFQAIELARLSAVAVIIFGTWGLLLLATATYIFLSPVVRKFYGE
jgi:hypothetical protein